MSVGNEELAFYMECYNGDVYLETCSVYGEYKMELNLIEINKREI